ncbi:MAG: MFS transporter [Gemmataceae bacterium]|nr:MFS transporter [Gemmataceae bacterium]
MKSLNDKMLFWASFLTLIAAGMGFSIRGEILADWGGQFGFTQTELGEITGMGLVGFGFTIIFFSFFADVLGYGKLMIVAFLLHMLTVALTLLAPVAYASGGKTSAFWCLYAGQLAFSLANGTCEAVINPLTATLYPNNKTHWLNILHAGWPGGLVLGALVALGLNQLGVGWEVKWGIILAPMLIYGMMMLGRPFPKSEASQAGVEMATMVGALASGLLLFLFLLHAMVGYVELGTDSWIINITNTVLANKNTALLAFIWTNVLMFTLRFFAGPIVHKISPLGLLFASAVLGTAGLAMLGMTWTDSASTWLLAVTVYGIGKTFYWPTMLGVVSERFPKAGALGLGLTGGIGMISAGLLGGPGIGYKQDFAAMQELRRISDPTYERYKAPAEQAPLPGLPKIAGLDNGKIAVLDDYETIQKKMQAAKEKNETFTDAQAKLQLEKDVEVLIQEKRTEKEVTDRLEWWKSVGQPNAKEDAPQIGKARLFGGKSALSWTAAVPAMMAVGYLILILYFRMRGGYKAEVLVGHAAEDEKFTGGVGAEM